MKRLHVLLVTNTECEEDKAAHMLDKMGHVVWTAFDAEAAKTMLQGSPGTGKDWSAVIIDGFSIAEAEEIALDIRMQFEYVYIGIMVREVQHRVPNGYANEAIPQAFVALKEALGHQFPEVV